MSTPSHARRSLVPVASGFAILAITLAGCGSSGGSTASGKAPASAPAAASAAAAAAHTDVAAQVKLYAAMRQLWAEHMEWTYATVDAFFHDQKALKPTLDRLLQNQRDIGAAVVPFYGQAAGDQLTQLLLAHINGAVPVLQAAQAGDSAAVSKATDAWYANAKQIADLLSTANPANWPTSATEPMLKEHITQTVSYAVDLLKGDFAQAIIDYGKAEEHMGMLADTLSAGIIAQFPEKFAG